MAATTIEWASHVWNPLSGCSPKSSGCALCYAAKMSKRLAAMARAGAISAFPRMTARWRC